MAENARGGGALVFGRVTYEQMASFWPTRAGRAANAAVAEGMTAMPKYVASRTLGRTCGAPTWANTTVLGGDLAAEIRGLKATLGPDLTILGSGTVVAQLTDAGLVDEDQLVVNPVVLGRGRSLFDGVGRRVPLVLRRTRAFANGNVVSWYEPVGPEPGGDTRR